jgi:hypothetical protein
MYNTAHIKSLIRATPLLIDAITSDIHALLIRNKARHYGKTFFLTQYYCCGDSSRQKEIDDCIVHNTSLPWIDQVILLCESNARPPACNSIDLQCNDLADRATFLDLFKALETFEPSVNDVAILANTDIFLDDSICSVLPYIRSDDLLALNRYETRDSTSPFLMPGSRPGSTSWSQDTWIFKCSIFDIITASQMPNLPLGMLGTENLFARYIYDSGISISNPCLGVRTIHNHQSELRSYSSADRLEGLYAFPRAITKNQFITGTRIPPFCLASDG